MKQVHSLIPLLFLLTFSALGQGFSVKSTDATDYPKIKATVQVDDVKTVNAADFKVLEERKPVAFTLDQPTDSAAKAGVYVLTFTTANPKNGRLYQYEVRYKEEKRAATYTAPDGESGGSGWSTGLLVLLITGGLGWFLYRSRKKKVVFEAGKQVEPETLLRNEEMRSRPVPQAVQPVPSDGQSSAKNLHQTMIAGNEATPFLKVTAGKFSQNFPLNQPQLSIGRAPENDIVIPESTVSGKHATLLQANGAFYLTDAGSTNGTFVNKIRVTGKQALKPGDVIRMGAAQLEIR